MKFRIESDTMGEVKVPQEALYGASTQRAVDNFQVSHRRFDRRFIQALGFVKWASAMANGKLGRLDPKLAKAIAEKALLVANGDYDSHFILDIFQTGSGTSTNMNANEVIAHLAKKSIHPNDHVNCGQSSNDVIPTAIHVGAALGFEAMMANLKILQTSLAKKSEAFSSVIKIGRTHLQDATPVTLGQEFSGYASQIKHGLKRVEAALHGLLELPIGGTAVGTGINTHPKFAETVCDFLDQKTGLNFFEAENHFEAQGAKDACVFASGVLKSLAISLMKIANDLRWLASGPRCGIGEIFLPELQPGSSIMPGKINPVIPESVMQIAAQVQGNDLAVQLGAQHGNFELNVMMPVIAGNLFESIELITNGSLMLAKKCVDGIKANEERCRHLMETSLALVTNLNREIGYDKAATIAKKAYKENRTLRDIILEEKILSEEKLNILLDPKSMLKPS